MSAQKILIIVLVVLVVIFVITVGMGGCHHGGRTPSDAGAVKALKGLQGNRFLEIGDKATVNPPSCGAPGAQTLTVNPTCIVTFQKRAFFRRSTRVALLGNRPLRVIIDPKDGPRQDESINAFECFGSAVNHSGGTMTVVSGTGAATVALRRQACPE
jgi:hypothetical protein